ncbi:META domain-containing protein [Branchiibius sp. NY16-3462-2]|uniref:META domain-containing protein n=1 Tax=Branchiibius sp. NY16-3462-2 TaxID=1807500 RepID=UPI00079AAE68|nr:META domain-containing protein [Branchiibius sp. NY16-3462-2]KYH45333.1 hypothetical protein AZH51_05515 [Branchiibius sp. NY16-3462-2]
MRMVAVVALAATALAGCGSSSSSPSTATGTALTSLSDLNGKSFVSTSVKGHDLVSGTAITLKVTDGSLSLNGGCNMINGAATVSDGVLKFTGHPIQTMMSCGDEKDAQDKWLTETFMTGVSPTISGDVMTLTHGDLTIVMGPGSAAASSK